MANGDILNGFSPSDISHFKNDFTQMMKVGNEIDRYYGEASHHLDFLLPKYERLAEKFNKKYKGVKLRTKKTIEAFKIRLFVKEKNVKDFFANSASRIPGLKSVGRSSTNQVEISNSEKFAAFLDSLLDKAYVSYSDYENGTSTVGAVFDRNEKMVELIYDPSEIVNENSAAFKISAFYALQSGFDRKIEIYPEASTFGFTNLLDEAEKREWHDKFNPRFLE